MGTLRTILVFSLAAATGLPPAVAPWAALVLVLPIAFGAGYGHFFSGQFIQKTTPGVGPTYLYVFHSYSL